MAFFLAMLLFSMAGIPPLAGFFAKFYVFLAAIKAGLYALAVIGVVTSVIGAYYYLYIVKLMYFDEPAETRGNAVRAPCCAGDLRLVQHSLLCLSRAARRHSQRRGAFPILMQLDPTAIEAGVRLDPCCDRIDQCEARLRAQHGERGPLWITATAQSEGRGRHGRTWISPPGNLYASLLLSDPSPFEHAPQLAFVAALALRDAIVGEAAALTPQLAFKWPNDLLLAGDKCAGILIEGDAAFDGEQAQAPKRLSVIVGFGVNCTSHPLRSGGTESFPATDLQAHGAG